MKKILTGEEQLKDTFICTLVKLFGIEKYGMMEKFCNEVEISFSILNERNIVAEEYFEFLNSIKFDLLEENKNSLQDNSINNIPGEAFNSLQVDAMDMDDNQKENITNTISKLLEEANTIEPSNSTVFSNPAYNSNFYIIFLLVLIINNQMDSARYLYRRLPRALLNNRTLVFIKFFLSCLLKKDVGKALSLLNKEIENEIKKEGESADKEEDLIEEDIINEKANRVKSRKGKKSNQKSGSHDETMDIYQSSKDSDVSGPSKGKIIENNTPEQSSDTIINMVKQVDTPEEQMKDIDYDDEEIDEDRDEEEDDEEDEDDDDDEDEDDDDDNDNDNDNESDSDTSNNQTHTDGNNNNNSNNETSSKSDIHSGSNNMTNMNGGGSGSGNKTTKIVESTMTPVDTETPISTSGNDVSVNSVASGPSDTKKTFFKIKRCSLFIKELLICLLNITRKRQISLIAKAYDRILVKEVAKTLDYSEEEVVKLLTTHYGWEVEPAQNIEGEIMFIPKREIKEKKQQMSIKHIDTLINHLILLEDSDQRVN